VGGTKANLDRTDLFAVDPIEKEEYSDHEWEPCDDGVYGPGETLGREHIKDRPSSEDHGTDPFPAPCQYDGNCHQYGWDQVDKKTNDGLANSQVHFENVQCKQAEEQDEKNRRDAR